MRWFQIAALAALPAVAYAGQPPALHGKYWYVAHPAERNATVRWCEADESHARLYDCRNAEAASTVADAPGGGADFMALPEFWTQNPQARAMLGRLCANAGAPGTGPWLRYCRFAGG